MGRPKKIKDAPTPAVVEKRKVAPFSLNIEIAQEICALVSTGSTLQQIAKQEGMPSVLKMYEWLNTHKYFADAYKEAIKWRGHSRFDKMDEVIEEVKSKALSASEAKTISDIMKWQCSKDDVETYGDKITQQHTGKNGEQLVIGLQRMLDELPPSVDVKV